MPGALADRCFLVPGAHRHTPILIRTRSMQARSGWMPPSLSPLLSHPRVPLFLLPSVTMHVIYFYCHQFFPTLDRLFSLSLSLSLSLSYFLPLLISSKDCSVFEPNATENALENSTLRYLGLFLAAISSIYKKQKNVSLCQRVAREFKYFSRYRKKVLDTNENKINMYFIPNLHNIHNFSIKILVSLDFE